MAQFQVGQRVEVIPTPYIEQEFNTQELLTGTVSKVFNDRGTGIMVKLDNNIHHNPLSFSPNEIRPVPKRQMQRAA